MKIGYPCINLSLNCRSSRTFRLKNYSENRLIDTIENNLDCLEKILKFNYENDILFFRISSDLIPFASHPIMQFNWQKHFNSGFKELGDYIKKSHMRITMHPGQYTVINSTNLTVIENSIKELKYHADVLNLLGLDSSAKITTHIGGVYGNKQESLNRFIERYKNLDERIKNHYVIENDDKNYNLNQVLKVSKLTGIPIILDIYHHFCNNSGASIQEAIEKVSKTWKREDGLPILHYSSEHPIKGKCRHADEIDIKHFTDFIEKTKKYDFDLMLEIKNKEKSTLLAIKILTNDIRFNRIKILE
ncbi:MAG: UV DNA damage repair endonuclease UvsE [Promethearchaeota archaeon]|nr:MAG: UV DNA damage repair endonuclease UvsE [Candidatus Lokiarchaeota archaeon]